MAERCGKLGGNQMTSKMSEKEESNRRSEKNTISLQKVFFSFIEFDIGTICDFIFSVISDVRTLHLSVLIFGI